MILLMSFPIAKNMTVVLLLHPKINCMTISPVVPVKNCRNIPPVVIISVSCKILNCRPFSDWFLFYFIRAF
jgi:hypothetical protein